MPIETEVETRLVEESEQVLGEPENLESIENQKKPRPLFDIGEKIDTEKLMDVWKYEEIGHGSMQEGKSRWYDNEGNMLILSEVNTVDKFARNNFEKGEIIPDEMTLVNWGLEQTGNSDPNGNMIYLTQDQKSIVAVNKRGLVVSVGNNRGY